METLTGKQATGFQETVLEVQNLTILGIRSLLNLFRRPLYLRETFELIWSGGIHRATGVSVPGPGARTRVDRGSGCWEGWVRDCL